MRAKASVTLLADNRLILNYLLASQSGVCTLKETSFCMCKGMISRELSA
jgi:hypothetical protein